MTATARQSATSRKQPAIAMLNGNAFTVKRLLALLIIFTVVDASRSLELGDKCQHDMDCTDFIKGSSCSALGYCECAPYFVQLDSKRCLSSQLLGGDCQLSEQCSMKVANSSCLEGACRCVEGFLQFRKHTCLGPAHPGAVCYSHAHCQMFDTRTHCDFLIPNLFGRCQCTSPAKMVGGLCVAPAADQEDQTQEQAIQKVEQPASSTTTTTTSTTTTTTTPRPTTRTTRRTTTTTTTTTTPAPTTRGTTTTTSTTTTTTAAPILLEDELPASVEEQSLEEDDGETTKLRPEVVEVDNGEKLEAVDMAHEETELTQQQNQLEEQQHQEEEQKHQEEEQHRVEQQQTEVEEQQHQQVIAQPSDTELPQLSQDATTGVQQLLTPADVPTEDAINAEQETEAGPTEDYPYKIDEEYTEEHNDKPEAPEAPELTVDQPEHEETPVAPEIVPIEADEEAAEASGGEEIASSPIDDTMKFDYETSVDEAEPAKPEDEKEPEVVHQAIKEEVVPIDTESETDADTSTEPQIQTQLLQEDGEPETSQTVADEELIPVNEAEIESVTKAADVADEKPEEEETPEDLASGDHELDVAVASHDDEVEPPKQEEPTEALKIEQPAQVESESPVVDEVGKPEEPHTEVEIEKEIEETPATEAAEVELPATEAKPDVESEIDQVEQSADIKPTSGEDDLNEANQLNQDQVTEPAALELEEIEEKEPEQVVEIHQDADEATTEKPDHDHDQEEAEAITEAEHEQLTYPTNDDELAPVEIEPELTTEEPEVAENTTELLEQQQQQQQQQQDEEEIEEAALGHGEEQQVEPEENANAIKTPEVSEAIAEPQADLETPSATEKEIEPQTADHVEEEPVAITERIQVPEPKPEAEPKPEPEIEPTNDEVSQVDADQAEPELPIKSDTDISEEATEEPAQTEAAPEVETETEASESAQTSPEISVEQDEVEIEKNENDNIIQGAEPTEEEEHIPEPQHMPQEEASPVPEETAAVPEEQELAKPDVDYTSVEHLQELSQPEETTAAIEAEEFDSRESTLAPEAPEAPEEPETPEAPETPIAIVSEEHDPEHDPQNFHESESIADILSDLMLEGDSTVPPVPFGQQPAQTVPMVEANSENEEEHAHEAVSDLQAEADETLDHAEQVQPAGEPETAIPELFAEAAKDEEDVPAFAEADEVKTEPPSALEEEHPIPSEEEHTPVEEEHQDQEAEHQQDQDEQQQDEAEAPKEEEALKEVETESLPEEATTEKIQEPELEPEEEHTLSPEELPFDLTDHSVPNRFNELESESLILEATTSIDGLQELDNNHIEEEEEPAAHAIPHEEATPNPADIVEITTQTMLGLASRVTLMEPAAPVVTTLMPLMTADEPTPEPVAPAAIPPASLPVIKPGTELRKRVDLGLEAVSLGLACSSDRQCQLADPHTVCNGRGVCDCAAGDEGTQCSAERTGCSPGTFQCRSSGVCISWFFVCDGRADCNDASDEECTHNARRNQTCPTESFRCQLSGRCISRAALCDGRRQCPHGEDEMGCDGSLKGGNACPPHTFRCGSGECLPEYEYCNAIVSCKDGSDEPPHLCGSRALPNLFMRLIEAGGLLGGGRREADAYCPHRCSNGLCRSTAIVCSGRDGCGDGTDEQTCAVCRCPAPTAASLPAFLARQRPMPLW
ncbi:titin [Drosophila teissieri]|uniref:titin n=1 Tax=Drosophila teissieri TaxID=7243 RepID=UPI001CBA51EA|nr:titin [Drosophila teissieri]